MEAVNGGMMGEDKGGPPPPSPLTGCYLLVVIGEPHSGEHKDIILQRVAKGLLSWNVNNCMVDLEKELAILTDQGLEGEEARYGERLIQFASENLVTEILIHPAVSTLSQCVRNLLSSFTRHRHIIHAGYTFQGNGSWAVQDGTFSYSDFSEAFQEIEVQRVIHAYENGISLDLHCSPEGEWNRLPKETFTKACKVHVNPTDVLTTGSPSISNFIKYLGPFLVPTSLENILESSDVVGNIRFSRPTLYVFPGGQGDAALFGINGFNMLLDGGYSRKACFWDFVRHLDRLDAVLMTRLNNSSICGISSVLKRKRQGAVYPQVGHFFCNIQERKSLLSPDGDKDKDPLIFSILEEGQSIVQDLQHLNLTSQSCYRDQEPIILYHKVGHGTLNMYVLSPDKNSREVREFLQKWNQCDPKMFAGTRGGRDFNFPLQNLVSICALLVWQPANPNDTITRILYPGSTPQKKIFEGFERLKNVEYIKHPLCSEKSLAPVKKSKQEVLDKLSSKDKVMGERRMENKLIEDAMKNGDMNGDVVREKHVKKSDSLESDKEKKMKRVEDKKVEESKKAEKIEDVVENGDKAKTKLKYGDAKPIKKRGDSQHRKKPTTEKRGPTTPKKTVENKTNGEAKEKEKERKAPQKPSPSATPAKSTKDANNRRVIESKKTPPRKEAATKPAPPTEVKPKPERKPISRRPKAVKGPPSPMKKMTNGVQKPDSISKRGKLDKEGTTDSSTVSTPSADQDSVLKKDISKLTPEEIQQLKDKELDELKEEQEAVKELEAVFRKGEGHAEEAEPGIRKIKDMSIDDNLDTEEYLIIEKEEIEHDSLDQEAKEDEMQKLARDSEESEKQRKLSSEEKEIDILKEEVKDLPSQEIISQEDVFAKVTEDTESRRPQLSSPEDKATPTTDKKELADEEVKEIVESHPEEKVSGNVESGATTTAPTLPEDERITLDDIKEDHGQAIEEKHVKEETKEKELPVIQLPPQTQPDSQAKMPLNVGISLDKQKHIRDIVKTPDEVADLPVHEEADFHEFHGDGKKSNEPEITNEQAKANKKIEEKKEGSENVAEHKADGKEKEEELKKEKVEEKLQREVHEEIQGEEKYDEQDKEKATLEYVTEKKDIADVQESKKEIIDDLFAVKKTAKDVYKDVKTESQSFLEQEKAAHDRTAEELGHASDVPIIERTMQMAESNQSDDAQKFEILEKADMETKEKVEIDIASENLKETIDDEWVVITKEDEVHDGVETAQEAGTSIAGNVDLKEEEEIIEKHELVKPKKEDLPEETKAEEGKIYIEEKVVESQGNAKEKEIESEGECDDHDIRVEDEIQETFATDKEDIKKLLEEADKKNLSAQKVDDHQDNTETIIKHIKDSQHDVAETDDKIQELRKDIHVTVDEMSFSRTKRDLTKIEAPAHKDLKEDGEELTKIDDKLQELKHKVEDILIENAEIKIEQSTKSPEHAEQVTLPDSSPDDSDHVAFGDLDIDKNELGRKSPAEREEDVKKIVVSVAEVLKSEAPLEEFQGKLPFTQELRETHITTQDSPIIEAKVTITDDIPPIPEEPAGLTEEPADMIDRRKDLIAGAQELMAASSKVISDIKSKAEEKVDKVDEQLEKLDEMVDEKLEKNVNNKAKIHEQEEKNNKEEKDDNVDKDDKDDDSGIVHRMLVTASSEDGGEEIEICPPGTITFSKSSESSGRSSPEPSQKTQSQKSSIVEILSDSLSTVKQITEKDLGIEKEEVDDQSVEQYGVLDAIKGTFESAKQFLEEKIENTSKDTHKAEAKVGENVSDVIKSAETLAQDSKDKIQEGAQTVEVEVEKTQDNINDLASDVKELETHFKEEIREISKKVDDKTTEVLEAVSGKVVELCEKAKSVTDEAKSIKKEETKECVTEIFNDISSGIAHAKETLENKTDDALKTSEKVKDLIKAEKDETIDKSKKILTDITSGTADTKHTLEDKVDDTLKAYEEVKDIIKEESKERKDETVDKSKEILTDISINIADTKETIGDKVGDALKRSVDVKDVIKEEIKAEKDVIVDQSKEILTDICTNIADIDETIENKIDDVLKTSEEVKDLVNEKTKVIKEETVDKAILTNVSGGIGDARENIESNVTDALKTLEAAKYIIEEGKAVDESKEILTEISASAAADKRKTTESKISDAIKISDDDKGLPQEEFKLLQGSKIDELITEGVKSTKGPEDNLAPAKDVTEHELKAAKEAAAPTSDFKEKTDSTNADIEDFIGRTAKHILNDTQNVAAQGAEDLKKVVDKIDETVVSSKDAVVKEVEKVTSKIQTITDEGIEYAETIKETAEDKLHEVKDDISTKVEAVVTGSSAIADKTKDELVGGIVDKIQDEKEKVLGKVDDLSINDIHEEAKGAVIGNVRAAEVKISDTKAIIEEQSQIGIDKGTEIAESITHKIKEDFKEVKDAVIATKEDVSDKISNITASVLDFAEKIEETIGIKMEHIENTKSLAAIEGKTIDKVEIKLTEEQAAIIPDQISSANAETKEATPERRSSVVEKAEELLQKSEQVIGSVFSTLGDAAKSVLHEIIPDDKISDSEIKSAKAELEHLAGEKEMGYAKRDSILDPTHLSGKSTPEAEDKERILDASPAFSGKSSPDLQKSVNEVETSDIKVADIEQDIKEKDHKITDNIPDLKTKTEPTLVHATDTVKESLENEEKVITSYKKSETEAKSGETTCKKGVVEKAEEFLEKSEKAIESSFTANGDAAKSDFNDILPDTKSTIDGIKMEGDHIKKDHPNKLDSTSDSTALSGISTPDVSHKGSSLEASPGISGKSTPDLQTDNTAKETEKPQEKSIILQDELEAIKMGVSGAQDQKADGSDHSLKQSDAKDSDKISHDESMDNQVHGIEATEADLVEKSVFASIEDAAKTTLHDVVSIDDETCSEEKENSPQEKQKVDDKKENLQHEEKEIEDNVMLTSYKLEAESEVNKTIPFDLRTSDKVKMNKEISEKKIEEQEEEHPTALFEKCKRSGEDTGDKGVIGKEEKQLEPAEVGAVSKSISFDKCHILEDDKLVQKQIETLEKTLGKVSDMTKSIVLERNELTAANTTEKKENAPSLDVVIDSNKLGDLQSSSSAKCEKKEVIHEEKKDPEKEHPKVEETVEEELKEAKQTQKECVHEESIKIGQEPPKQEDKEAQQPLELLQTPLECDMTNSVHIEKSDSSPESHKLNDKISETSKPEKTEDIFEQDDISPNAKDNVVLEDQRISSQTEKCEKESMEKTSIEKDASSLRVERTEPKKLSISDVEICIKTEECPKGASQSFLDNERALLRDNPDAKVYVRPISSQDADEAIVDQASSSSVLRVAAEVPSLSDKSSPDLELSGKSTPSTVPVSPIAKEIKSPSLKLDSGLSEQTDTDDEDLSTKSQVAHSQSDLDELDMKMDPMSMSFYGALPGEQGEGDEEVPATLLYEITKAKFATELQQEDQESEKKRDVDLMTDSFIGELPGASIDSKPTESKEDISTKDAVDSWGKPLGLPAPTYLYEVTKAKFSSSAEETDLMTCSFIGDTLPTSSSQERPQKKAESDPMTTSVYFEHSDDSGYDPIASWGKPLGLPSPAPPNNNEKGTPKKERKVTAYVTAKNKLNDDKKRAESPSKLKAKKINPVYVDLTYVPHHGNHHYSYVDFFKKIRARYYVFSGLEPSRQVYDALLEAKQTWEDKELEVTIIPTYDTDILGYWVAENEELLSKFKIDLSPSASRCTINLQDHETSCSAYRLEF